MPDLPPESDPQPPRPPPQMSALFVIVWVIGLLGLVALGGCTIMLISMAFGEEMGLEFATPAGALLMLAALYGFGRSLVQARRKERAQQPPSTVFLYAVLIPVVTVFVWAGGCLLALR